MNVLDLKALLSPTDGAGATYEGIPGVGAPASAPPGLFASLLSSEQLALLGVPLTAGAPSEAAVAGASPVVEGAETPAAATDGESAEALLLAAVGGVAPTAPAPQSKAEAGNGEGQVPVATEANAAKAAGVAVATVPAPVAAAAKTAEALVVSAEAPVAGAQASEGTPSDSVPPDTDAALFASIGTKPSEPVRGWVRVPVDINPTPTGDGAAAAKSTAQVETLPPRAAGVETGAGAAESTSPDTLAVPEEWKAETAPTADLGARSRAEVVIRKLLRGADATKTVTSANPASTEAGDAASAVNNVPAKDVPSAVKPVQVAQLDTPIVPSDVTPANATEQIADVDSVLPATRTEGEIADAALRKAKVDSPTVKSIEASPDGTILHRGPGETGSVASATHPRVELPADGPPVMRTPATEFTDAAVKAVRYLASQGEHTMRIKLIPENLGEMQLVVRSVGEALHIHMTAAHGQVRDVIEAQMQGLRDQLAKEGIEVAKITISADTGSGQQFAQQSSGRDTYGALQHARDGTPWRGYSGSGPPPRPDTPWTPPGQLQRSHAGALNLFA